MPISQVWDQEYNFKMSLISWWFSLRCLGPDSFPGDLTLCSSLYIVIYIIASIFTFTLHWHSCSCECSAVPQIKPHVFLNWAPRKCNCDPSFLLLQFSPSFIWFLWTFAMTHSQWLHGQQPHLLCSSTFCFHLGLSHMLNIARIACKNCVHWKKYLKNTS